MKDIEDDSDFDYMPNKRKDKARRKGGKKIACEVGSDSIEKRLVPKGVSVFDLIMPWKEDIHTAKMHDSEVSTFSRLESKNNVVALDLKQYANDVQAILVNPPWDCSKTGDQKKGQKTVSITDFKKFKIPPEVMKDGLLFIWVEKEIIFELIKHFEDQGFFYVENVCYIMLDQTKKEGKFKWYC